MHFRYNVAYETTNPALESMIISVYRQTPELVDWDVEVVVAILKRIRKSIRVWNKRGGIRGYLNFIGEFIP